VPRFVNSRDQDFGGRLQAQGQAGVVPQDHKRAVAPAVHDLDLCATPKAQVAEALGQLPFRPKGGDQQALALGGESEGKALSPGVSALHRISP
jgi:hypothetical protein